ncbi:MAG: hypothetical protein LBN33_03480 [Desulfovibrio sp.]|nr:hypothetical protein [Desulfovibrio sp.]
MSTIVGQSELVRRAFMHLNDLVRDNPGKKVPELVDEAAMRFNLSPLDSEALYRMFKDAASETSSDAAKKT